MDLNWLILLEHLSPHLRLYELQALGQVCRGIRSACGSLAHQQWLLAAVYGDHESGMPNTCKQPLTVQGMLCRNTLPREHPICLDHAAATVPQQADDLACLHRAPAQWQASPQFFACDNPAAVQAQAAEGTHSHSES